MITGVIVMFIVLLVSMTISIPIGVSLGVATFVGIYCFSSIDVLSIASYCFTGLNSFTLMAIPFFILAGNLMKFGGISRRILDFAGALVGTITGGIGMVTVLASMFFAAISGSAPATVTAIGGITIPEMKQKGYDLGYAAAVTAASGTIGVIIPPSIPFVIYGVVSGSSIADLFIAGIIPGILVGVALMAVNYLQSKKHGYEVEKKPFKAKNLWDSFRHSILALLCPVIILGGIYAGIFTPTESAVVASVYAIIVGLIYRELNVKELYIAFKDTVLVNGQTTFMIGLSMAFAAYLTMAQIPTMLASGMLSLTSNPIIILILINIILLIIGCFIDNISSCIILTPILLPIATGVGMDPVQFGVLMTINLAIGFITPPYGANLFFASAVAETSVENISKRILPFIVASVIVLLLVTYISPITMWLPSLMK
ncbi:TRAP transporter large permease [bacterium 210820-DFI.6.37]|nr:TRAP transporter large permease [bacterium 210820-DFI.6.37]